MDNNKPNTTKTRRTLNTNALQTATEIGKLPPSSVNIEEAVLGAMMLGQQAVNDAIDILHADSFYKPEHQKIFSAILQLPPNLTEPLTVSADLAVTFSAKTTLPLTVSASPTVLSVATFTEPLTVDKSPTLE